MAEQVDHLSVWDNSAGSPLLLLARDPKGLYVSDAVARLSTDPAVHEDLVKSLTQTIEALERR
jgi:hypothetical protein